MLLLRTVIVIIAGQIDISVGSQFAVCSVAAGILAKTGIPTLPLFAAVLLIGVRNGNVEWSVIGLLRLPSIIVTLAMLVVWRDVLRWATEGAWVPATSPSNFQWFGLRQSMGEFVIFAVTIVFFVIAAWSMRDLVAGRKGLRRGFGTGSSVPGGHRASASSILGFHRNGGVGRCGRSAKCDQILICPRKHRRGSRIKSYCRGRCRWDCDNRRTRTR